MRVIVTRPAAEAVAWVAGLQARGFEAIAFPLIEIAPVSDAQSLHKAWGEMAAMRAAMFVSANAVRHFFAARPVNAQWPVGTRAWATGPGTLGALLDAGVNPSLVDSPPVDAAQFDSETLWRQVAPQVRAGDALLIVRGADADGEPAGRDWLAGQLASAGAQVRVVASYVRRGPPSDALPTSREGDVWLLSSSQAIAHLVALSPDADRSSMRAVATHPRIADSALRAGFGVVCESRPGLEPVSAALESFR